MIGSLDEHFDSAFGVLKCRKLFQVLVNILRMIPCNIAFDATLLKWHLIGAEP